MRGLVTLTVVGAAMAGLVATPAVAADGAAPATYTVPDPPAVDAVRGLGTAEATFAPDAVPAAGPGGLHPVTPVRLVDTRTATKLGAGAVLQVPVAGRAGLPASGV